MISPILPFLIIHTNNQMAFENQQKIIKQQKENEENEEKERNKKNENN